MAASGVTVQPVCIEKFNELKLGKDIKFVIYRLSDDFKEIIVEESSKDKEWETFREKLVNAKSKAKGGKESMGPRFAVYDFQYEIEDGGVRNKITFISWNPDDASISLKMTYSSSKEALKRSLNGIAVEVQANDPDDIEWESIKAKVSKGAR